jgi:hypothetical protein
VADNTAKIIIEASADGVLRAAEQMRKGFKTVGEEGGKAGEKLGISMLKAVVSGGALLGIVRGVADAYNQAAANAAKLSKETGGRQVSGEIAGQRLGMSSAQSSGILRSSGPRTAEERSSFLSALADAKGPGGRPIDASTAQRAVGVYNSGTVDQGEILKVLAKSGGRGLDGLESTATERFNNLSDRAKDELAQRTADNDAAQRQADKTADRGFFNRVAERNRAEQSAGSGVAEAAGVTSTDATIKTLREIADHQRQTAENTRPRLNTSANGPGGN